MATVIADTSPLQYLHQVGQLELLHALFGTIVVPEQVRDELRAGLALGVPVPDPTCHSWMAVRHANPASAVERFALGSGETAALSLALESSNAVVVLDDAAARAAASELGLARTGTLGVLLLAKQRSFLDAIAPVLGALEHRGFRLGAALRARVMALAGEE